MVPSFGRASREGISVGGEFNGKGSDKTGFFVTTTGASSTVRFRGRPVKIVALARTHRSKAGRRGPREAVEGGRGGRWWTGVERGRGQCDARRQR